MYRWFNLFLLFNKPDLRSVFLPKFYLYINLSICQSIYMSIPLLKSIFLSLYLCPSISCIYVSSPLCIYTFPLFGSPNLSNLKMSLHLGWSCWLLVQMLGMVQRIYPSIWCAGKECERNARVTGNLGNCLSIYLLSYLLIHLSARYPSIFGLHTNSYDL